MASWSAVEQERRGHVSVITLARPEKKNAINRAMRFELQSALTAANNDDDVWLIVLTAQGDVFCSGKDLLETIPPGEDDGSVMSNDELYAFIRDIYKPVVCAVNGLCYAQGAGFALNADIVVMAEEASIGWPQVRRGISSVSGPSLAAHAMPWTQAMAYLMRGVPIPASECLRWGIANEVVPREELLDAALRWADEILANAPMAVRGIKEAARRGQELAFRDRMYMARDVANRVLLSQDADEGIAAFREKRPPNWTGR